MPRWTPDPRLTIPEDLDEFIPDQKQRKKLILQKMTKFEKMFIERMQRSNSFIQTSFSRRIHPTVNPYRLYKQILDLDAAMENLKTWLTHPVNYPMFKKGLEDFGRSFQEAYRFIPDYTLENQAMDRFLSKK